MFVSVCIYKIAKAETSTYLSPFGPPQGKGPIRSSRFFYEATAKEGRVLFVTIKDIFRFLNSYAKQGLLMFFHPFLCYFKMLCIFCSSGGNFSRGEEMNFGHLHENISLTWLVFWKMKLFLKKVSKCPNSKSMLKVKFEDRRNIFLLSTYSRINQ